MKILVLYNHATILKKGRVEDLVCEQEAVTIAPLIAETLRKKGHYVELMKTDLDLWDQLTKKSGQFEIIFNLAEGFGGANSNEFFVSAMLEALGLPFTGPSFRTYVFAYDKWKAGLVLNAQGIPIPQRHLFYPQEEICGLEFDFPAIVKPVHEDASLGITYDSVVSNQKDLIDRVQRVFSLYQQPALVERFIEGREISVGCIGNRSHVHVFPPLEFMFDVSTSSLKRIRSYEYKWDGGKEMMVRAELSSNLVSCLSEYTRSAFLGIDCQDYARMDYRLTDTGDLFLLEVNCNPAIGPNTHGLNNTLTMMAYFDGCSFEDLIERILFTAKLRYNL